MLGKSNTNNKKKRGQFCALLGILSLTACGGGSNDIDTRHTINTNAEVGGAIRPASAIVDQGDTINFTVIPERGYDIDTVNGCGGSRSIATYTTGAIIADCTVSASFRTIPPGQPVLSFVSAKTLRFSWTDVDDATHYKLLENPDGGSGFAQVGSDILQGSQSVDHEITLYARLNAQYRLQSCNAAGCTDSTTVSVSGTLVGGVGYVKASNTEADDQFGKAISLSGDGNTLAVGAYGEDNNVTGVSDENNNLAMDSGVVYIFIRSGGNWRQQAYLKADNTETNDQFGHAVSLSDDGNTLAVGGRLEDSAAIGVQGDADDNSATNSGAVYVFSRNGGSWSQQAYVKAGNTDANDEFGRTVSLSGDGNTLAVGADLEDSNTVGVDNDEANNSAGDSGAVYLFNRSEDAWSQQAYIKARNTGANDRFGRAVSLSDNGNTLAVGAYLEDSNATHLDGDENDNSANASGAVYVFSRSSGVWSQQVYLKASNTDALDHFGLALSLSGDGDTLAVGADGESSAVTRDESDNSANASGAVYVFNRNGSTWSQQAYVKASITGAIDEFGWTVGLSGDGNTLTVGAIGEDSNATGINGNDNNNSARASGAVYVFKRSGGGWSQQAYAKASNTGTGDQFGYAIGLNEDGTTLAVGAYREDGAAIGLNGNANDNSADASGAVYLY
jgi:hypothetical protein